MVSETFFLDTNVFMYAAGAPHTLKEPCVRVLADVEAGDLVAVTNTEVLQEILHRYRYLKVGELGLELCQTVLEYPMTILPVSEQDIRVAIEICRSHGEQGIQPRDAVHAATMRSHGIARIITADRGFDQIEGLMRIDPMQYHPL